MNLAVAWLVFPALLAALSAGCGLLVDAVTGSRMSLPLIALTGFALIIVVGQFLTLGDATAELTAPATVVLAVAGVGLGARRRPELEPWALVAGVVALAIYAAPIVLSGEPTIAGFIKLDDTATWLSLTDRVMEHGRDLSGLAPSSYEATLAFNLGDGYPVGVFLPLGIGAALLGADLAWVVQPYLAFGATLLALALWSLATPVADRPPLRAAAAVLGAMPALLYGYYLWGGIKEVVAAALIAAAVASLAFALDRDARPATLAAPTLAAAALIGVLSAGGLIWLAVPLIGGVVVLRHRIGLAATAARVAGVAISVAALSLPLAVSGALLPPTSSPLTDGGARGNLIGPLDPLQVAGIWPAGDFRVDPGQGWAAYLLIAIAVAAAVVGVAAAIRRRDAGPPLYVAGALAGCVALVVIGSPWVGGKALATASPAIPFAAMLGVGWLLERRARALGLGAATLVAGGLLWSNALAYGRVNLAPYEQLRELELIGERVGGQGPTLMTEYEPYGVRHFLRDSEPEGASELRRRTVPLTDGSALAKGESVDTDRIEPGALGVYRTLVLRRSPAQSRPPPAYRLIWSGDQYQAWQRSPADSPALDRLPLGDRYDPYGVPDCDRVRELARGGDLIAAAGRPPLVIPLSQATYPTAWATPATRYAPVPRGPGTIAASVSVDRPATYEVWLGGSLRPAAELFVDGEPAGSVRHALNNEGQYIRLGAPVLGAGEHRIEVRIDGADLHPGSAGDFGPVGPLVLSSSDASRSRLIRVPAAEAARRLCGRAWDWIEVAG